MPKKKEMNNQRLHIPWDFTEAVSDLGSPAFCDPTLTPEEGERVGRAKSLRDSRLRYTFFSNF
jgi:hypothetical protein